MLDRPPGAEGSNPLVDRASTTADTARADDDGMASDATRVRSATEAESDQRSRLRHIIDSLGANDLALVIALAYARLRGDDRINVQRADVELLRRLARQAHDFDSRLIEHADERRRVGERRGAISPEAANTAEWANRLADALDALLDGVREGSRAREAQPRHP